MNISFENGKIHILETTLRDGSYVIDFQFTAEDTELLARCLDELHMPLIEVGHGVGINASASKGRAAATDVEYVEAARRGSKNGLIGMFCIPGIASLDHLRACADAGLQFVRVGVNVDQYQMSKEFVELGKKLGLLVCTNYMKSYVLEPKAFAKLAKISQDYGSDLVYLVDSAGGMLPEDVKAYIGEIKMAARIPVGFHGHNNIQMAIANSLAALEAGATLVDTTLLGMGRSSGNAQTEIMVPLIQRKFKKCMKTDSIKLLDLSERVIAPMLKNRWENTEKTILGLSQVHSMYADKIRKAAEQNGKLLYSVVKEVGDLDKINLPDSVLEKAIQKAIPTAQMEAFFGGKSLVEELKDDSSIDEITRVAVKLNIPLVIEAGSEIKNKKVMQSAYAIRVLCSSEEAMNFADHSDTARKRFLFDQSVGVVQPKAEPGLLQRFGRS